MAFLYESIATTIVLRDASDGAKKHNVVEKLKVAVGSGELQLKAKHVS